MSDKNIIAELSYSKSSKLLLEINSLDRTIDQLKAKSSRERYELDELDKQINSLKAAYELKRHELHQTNRKLEEKIKISMEARKAYTTVFKL